MKTGEKPSARKRRRTSAPRNSPLADDAQEQSGPTGWEALGNEPKPVIPKDQKQPAPKLSKHAKHRNKLNKEKEIRDAERKIKGRPTSLPEYEQLVLASPNSSFIWIRYMSFLLSLGEVEKAKTIAKRAVATINYREDNERFNIWVAWLNIECHYGTDESIQELIKTALPLVDSKRFYLAAIDILEQAEKQDLASEYVQEMCKKYSFTPETWLRAFKFHLTQGNEDDAQRVLKRSLLSLAKSDHVGLHSKAGILEYKFGDAERGRSLFEGLLHDNPRRLDLWSIYIDQEIAQGDQQRIRSIFERATHLQLPPKKMKFLFKRYLDYEKQHGDSARVDHVKQRAMEFVERALAS